MKKKILKLAIPSIISNLTVPLMGLLDVAIVGHMSHVSYIGAIAIGGMMFSLLYWGFGFLRMGTGGLTAQAFGKKDWQDVPLQLIRPLLLALVFSSVILFFHRPLEWLILYLIGEPDSDLNHWASVYFRICVWGAPAVLSLYAFNGWFVGLQQTKITMYVAVFQNVTNVLLSLFFVFMLDMQVEGVAFGTLLGQWGGVLFALYWCSRRNRTFFSQRFSLNVVFQLDALRQYFHVNKHIFYRTLCLIAVTVSFTSFGARQGETMLAVNTLMMQLFTIFSYFMDGFAYAGEALAGACYGARNTKGLKETVNGLFFWGWCLSSFFTLLYGIGGLHFLGLLTSQHDILQACKPYIYWSALVPFCGFAAFLWDGIFIGITATRQMLYAMLAAMIIYFVVYCCLFPYIGNHGLWIAFLLYLSMRGLGQRKLFQSLI